jgi:glycosyltransferase involved in cell wall biosynthesis
MAQNAISVTLGVGSGPYQKTLVASLLREGMLRRVFSPGPILEIRDPGPDGSLEVIERFPLRTFFNRAIWAAWRRVPKRRFPPPVMFSILLSDRLWSQRMPPCTFFHSWMGVCEASLHAAKRVGAITLVENAARHPKHWHQAGVEECKRFGIDPKKRSTVLPPMLIRRVLREFELCDRIIVPSSASYRSFSECGLAEKTVIVPTGVDSEFFKPPAKPRDEAIFRICFVGRVELAKGAGYLLQAWKKLALPNAELVLVGSVKKEMSALLRTHADASVRMTGILPAAEVAQLYRESDLFVFPSINEGLPQVLLEAMASGLPVVVSDHASADDCVTDGTEGFVVPARNVDKLAEAIQWCYQHRDETRAIGKAARARIENEFTLEHYNQRQIALYKSLAG